MLLLHDGYPADPCHQWAQPHPAGTVQHCDMPCAGTDGGLGAGARGLHVGIRDQLQSCLITAGHVQVGASRHCAHHCPAAKRGSSETTCRPPWSLQPAFRSVPAATAHTTPLQDSSMASHIIRPTGLAWRLWLVRPPRPRAQPRA